MNDMFHSDIANLQEEAQKCMDVLGVSRFPLFVFTAKCAFLWPAQNARTRFIARTIISLYLSSLMILSIVQLFEEFNKVNTNYNNIVEGIMQIIVFSLVWYIYVSDFIRHRKMTTCMSIMFRLVEGNDSDGKKILDTIIQKTFWFSTIEAVGVLLLCASYALSPVVNPIILSWLYSDDHTYEIFLPLKMELFLDENNNFYSIFFIQFFIVIFHGIIATILNYYQCMLAGFIIAQLKCLEYYLNEIDNEFNCKISELDETKTNLICEKLKAIIRRHQNCIKIFEVFRSMVSPSAFGIIILDTFVLILTGTWMVITLANSDLTETAKMFFVFNAVLAVIIEICIPSQLMSNASYDFFLRSYCVNWYNYPVKARKLLIFIMARSMMPLALVAGPAIELNFETCSAVIKGTISYAATFRSLYASYKMN